MRYISLVIATLLLVTHPQLLADTCSELIEDAREAEATENWPAARSLFEQIQAECDPSQRDLLSLGRSIFETGDNREGIDLIVSALQRRPISVWSAQGWYDVARGADALGDDPLADEAIEYLRDHFPSSIWTTRADVLYAKRSGGDVARALAALDREEEAWTACDVAYNFIYSPDAEYAPELLEWIVASYRDTRSSLRAADILAHFLARDERNTDEALAAFSTIIAKSSASYPQSELVLVARLRLASLLTRKGQLAQARSNLNVLAMESQDRFIRDRAKIDLLFLDIEELQMRTRAGETVAPQQWARIRQSALSLRDPNAPYPAIDSVAETIALMTYAIERVDVDLLVQEASEILDRYPINVQHSPDTARVRLTTIAAVHNTVGEALLRARRFAEAQGHFEETIAVLSADRLVVQREMKGRATYRLYLVALWSGASDASIAAAAQRVLEEFPDSRWAQLVRDFERDRLGGIRR